MSAPLPAILDFPFSAPPDPGAVIEVAPGIHWMRMPLPFALDHINLWLVEEPGSWTQIDSGIGSEATRTLWERHFATTLRHRPISRIVVTHYHPDHAGNAAWLMQRFRCPLVMTHAEYLTVHAVSGEHSGYGVQATSELFRSHGMAPPHVEALAARGNTYKRGVPEVPHTFERLLDGDRLRMGGTDWRMLEGHGHSPEHASLYSAERSVLISGDMLLPRISTNVSVWPIEPDGDPLRRFLDSLDAFEALPPDTLVLPSHGLPFRGISLRVAQLRTHHAARLDELYTAVLEAGEAGCSAAELIPLLFRRELDLQQRYFAMGEAIAHLNHLWRAGRLISTMTAQNSVRFAVAVDPA
jgi:glyoxylase-like metal-dependent hydrolase (beta-lactamase superfamily II)